MREAAIIPLDGWTGCATGELVMTWLDGFRGSEEAGWLVDGGFEGLVCLVCMSSFAPCRMEWCKIASLLNYGISGVRVSDLITRLASLPFPLCSGSLVGVGTHLVRNTCYAV